MYEYKVGALYHPGRRRWPESPQFNFRQSEFELVLFYAGPTISEILAIKDSPVEFALVVQGDVIFLLYRFGTTGRWADAAYSYHLVPAAQQTPVPVLEETSRLLLHLLLVDANTGVIKVIRVVTLSADFSHKLVAAIAAQKERPFNSDSYDAQIEKMYRQYPESKSMLKLATARTVGGRD
jgi:hypothetical protein